jgi:hypothetical protein
MNISSGSTPTIQTNIGRHTISLIDRHVRINGYTILFDDVGTAQAFVQDLQIYADKLDTLDRWLAGQSDEEHDWPGIPGWAIAWR